MCSENLRIVLTQRMQKKQGRLQHVCVTQKYGVSKKACESEKYCCEMNLTSWCSQ